MSKHYTERARLAAKANVVLDRHEILATLTCQDTAIVREDIERTRLRVDNAGKFELRELLNDINATHKRAVIHSGYVGGPALLDTLHTMLKNTTEGRVPCLSIYELTQLFRRYDRTLPNLKDIPLHTFVQFYSHGTKDGGTTVELFRLDAAIHENMCALFNAYVERYSFNPDFETPKQRVKEQRAQAHACIVAALQFVEAYLNGIAFDYVAEHRDSIEPKVLIKLTEWDPEKKKRRSLSMREKILNYPRIITGLSHPPIQENNCDEMRYLLQESKSTRDSVVHASPLPDLLDLGDAKIPAFFATSDEHVMRTVDCATIVVRRIQESLGESAKPMPWLVDRDAHNRFPAEVFE